MPNRKGYDLEEFEELAFGDSAAGITPAEWATFQSRWRTLTTKKLSGCFEFTGSAIKPKNWVGVVESDAFTLQVVPRGSKALSEPERVRLSRNIDRILRIAISGRTIQVTEADLAAGGSRFDSAVESMCDLVLMARRRKQLRRYVARTEVTSSFQGRLLFPAQAITSIRRPGAFACHWVEPNQSTPENLFLKWAIRVLRPWAGANARRRLDQCLAEFDDVSDEDGLPQYTRIRYDRLPGEYADAIRLAKSLVDGELPGLFAGTFRSRSELVFMPDVFELFVRRMTADVSSLLGLAVATKTGLSLGRWLSGPHTGKRCFEVIPDVELRPSGQSSTRLLIDAKWKWLRPESGVLGIDEGDVHQMVTYLHRFGCSQGMLVYPWLSDQASSAPAIRFETLGAVPLGITIARIPLLWEKVSEASAAIQSALMVASASP